MEGSTSLFTSGFLGANFKWWVGQIADDSYWRENVNPNKHAESSQIPGWGRRYKVRIIGLHDKEEESIHSNDLPWAQIMYPVTAGGGQLAKSQTANLQQGNFVFGFFLDAEDMQTPVIMGVLGNNSQTQLKMKTGTTEQNFAPTSGYAERTGKPLTPKQKEGEEPPDHGRKVQQPMSAKNKAICGDPPAGAKLNKYGLRSDIALSSIPGAFDAVQAARNKAKEDGLSQDDENAAIAKAALDAKAAYCASISGPNSTPEGISPVEQAEDTQQTAVNDVKTNDLYLEKIHKEDPYDQVKSSMRGMQIALEKLMKRINKILHTALAYVDMVSNIGSGSICEQIEKLMQMTADILARHMKVIFDKIKEFIIKKINQALDAPTNLLFPNQRNMMGDMSSQITQLILCIFEKITAGLAEQLLSAMMGAGGGCNGADGSSGGLPSGLPSALTGGSRGEDVDQNAPTPDNMVNRVPMCYVENLTGDIIAANKEAIEEPMKKIIAKVDTFLNDMKNQIDLLDPNLVAASGGFPSMDGILGDISGAMNFMNLKFSLFGCDVDPVKAAADYYTFGTGGGAGEQADASRLGNINKSANNPGTKIGKEPIKPMALPEHDIPPLYA